MKVHQVVSISAQGIPRVKCGAWSGQDASVNPRYVTCKNCIRSKPRREKMSDKPKSPKCAALPSEAGKESPRG